MNFNTTNHLHYYKHMNILFKGIFGEDVPSNLQGLSEEGVLCEGYASGQGLSILILALKPGSKLGLHFWPYKG